MAKTLAWLVAVIASACDDGNKDWCEENVAHHCGQTEGGEVCTARDCGASYCVEVTDRNGPAAFCSVEPTPRDACLDPLDDDAYLSACEGAQLLKCSHGYVLETTDCGDPSLCVNRVYQCLVRPGVDATCAAQIAANNSSTSYCDGDIVIGCTHEYATSLQDCSPQRCYESPPYSGCR
jgi:hypothetical protein